MRFSPALKHKIHALCIESVQQKLDLIRKAITDAREALTVESKSSAGDKHETARAMLQLETEKRSEQLVNTLQLQEVLYRIHLDDISADNVHLGTLVHTSIGVFYISIGIGKLDYEGKEYMAISAASPIAHAMIGKQKGESITFNERKIDIINVT